jgi:hypothetical protein
MNVALPSTKVSLTEPWDRICWKLGLNSISVTWNPRAILSQAIVATYPSSRARCSCSSRSCFWLLASLWHPSSPRWTLKRKAKKWSFLEIWDSGVGAEPGSITNTLSHYLVFIFACLARAEASVLSCQESNHSQVWWCMCVIPAVSKLRQENNKFEANLAT